MQAGFGGKMTKAGGKILDIPYILCYTQQATWKEVFFLCLKIDIGQEDCANENSGGGSCAR